VALLASRRKGRDPEGRMPLREHLSEFRRRLIKAGLAILAGMIVGWFLSHDLIAALLAPLKAAAAAQGARIGPNFSSLTGAFSQKVRISLYTGVVLASPIWLYQLWAFIVPGLTRREKRYAMGFVAAAVPLFSAGIALAWVVVPNAVLFFAEFIPSDASALVDADGYLTFVTRVMLTFGVAFVVPLLLVALNLAHLVTGRTLVSGWRIAVFLTFLFAAMASPTPDATSMLALALPMVGLYMSAVGIALLVDRRRAKRAAADPIAGLEDDQASPLDDQASPLDDQASPLHPNTSPDDAS
jgi:sec-independent protein translocase protein TatC